LKKVEVCRVRFGVSLRQQKRDMHGHRDNRGGEGGFRFTRISQGERERVLLDCWGFKLVVERRPVPRTGRAEIVLLSEGLTPIPTPPPDVELILGAVPCELYDEVVTSSAKLPPEDAPILVADDDQPDDTAVDNPTLVRTA